MALDLAGGGRGAAAVARARALRRLAARPGLRRTKLVFGVARVPRRGAGRVPGRTRRASVSGGSCWSCSTRCPGCEVDSGLSVTQQAIFWEIRLPRVVLGVLVGAMLAVAGAAYQGVFRNPLADPYLLGISSGAGLGATLGIVAGGGVGPVGIPLLAFVGGLLGVAATYALGSTVGGGRGAVVIILAGVAVGAFFNAIQNFVQQQYDDSLLSVYSWMLGRLSTDGWSDVADRAALRVVSCVAILLHRRVLDVMAVGDVEAASLGVDPARVRLVLVRHRHARHRRRGERERADRVRRHRRAARGAAAVRRRPPHPAAAVAAARGGVPGARATSSPAPRWRRRRCRSAS